MSHIPLKRDGLALYEINDRFLLSGSSALPTISKKEKAKRKVQNMTHHKPADRKIAEGQAKAAQGHAELEQREGQGNIAKAYNR